MASGNPHGLAMLPSASNGLGTVVHDVPSSPAALASPLDALPPTHTSEMKKKKPGRSPSQIWSLLTDEANPQRKNAAACKHCKQQVLYYKKSEQAIRHLKKCTVFQSSQHQYAFIAQFQDVLPLYQQKISQKASSKKRQKAHAAAMAAAQVAAATAHAMASNQANNAGLMQHSTPLSVLEAQTAAAHHHANTMNALAIQQGMADSLMEGMHGLGGKTEDPLLKVRFTAKEQRKAKQALTPSLTSTPTHGNGSSSTSTSTTSPLSKAQQDRMEEALAMHAYVTGMSFDVMEETHLQRAMATLRSNVKLPEKKNLEEELMLRCYDKLHKRVWGYLTANTTQECLKPDAWSNMNLYNTSVPNEVYVTYLAMNAEKRFFLESEKIDASAQFNSILIAQDIVANHVEGARPCQGGVALCCVYHRLYDWIVDAARGKV